MNHSAKRKPYLTNKWLIAISILISLLLAELVFRDYRLGMGNLITRFGGDMIRHHYEGLYAYDPKLGWAPLSNSVLETWGTTVHTLEDGIRSNGNPSSMPARPLILASGDSFTFGEHTPDHLTWPALLEKELGHKVLNGGVSSYGIDQITLRAEQLYDRYDPDVVIIAFIFEDIARCAQKVRHGIPKPYFTVHDGVLRKETSHIQFIQNPRMDPFRAILGHSHLAHKLMARHFPNYWWKNTMRDIQLANTDPLEVTRLLFRELVEKVSSETLVVFVILPQYNLSERFQAVLNFFKNYLGNYPKGNVGLVDVDSILGLIASQDPNLHEQFFMPGITRHITPEGNQFIADLVAQKIRELNPSRFPSTKK